MRLISIIRFDSTSTHMYSRCNKMFIHFNWLLHHNIFNSFNLNFSWKWYRVLWNQPNETYTMSTWLRTWQMRFKLHFKKIFFLLWTTYRMPLTPIQPTPYSEQQKCKERHAELLHFTVNMSEPFRSEILWLPRFQD